MSMKMCDDRHEEVVFMDYDHRTKRFLKCPVCDALSDLAGADEDLDSLRKAYEELKVENESLTKECEKYQQIIDSDGGDR